MSLSPSPKQDWTVLEWEAHGRETSKPLRQHVDPRSHQHRTRHGAHGKALLRFLGPQGVLAFVEDKGHHQRLLGRIPRYTGESKCPRQDGCLQTQPLTGLSCSWVPVHHNTVPGTRNALSRVGRDYTGNAKGRPQKEEDVYAWPLCSVALVTTVSRAALPMLGLDGSPLTSTLWDLSLVSQVLLISLRPLTKVSATITKWWGGGGTMLPQLTLAG